MIQFVAPEKDETEEGVGVEGESALTKAGGDQAEREDASIVEELSAQGVASFIPDVFFENLTSNYAHAEQLYGKRLISLATGEDSEYVRRNVRIPEFRDLLKKRLKETNKNLTQARLIDDGDLTPDAYLLAAQVMLTEELERLYTSSFNEMRGKTPSRTGLPDTDKPYRKERYRDIDIRRSIRTAMRRGHDHIGEEDLAALVRTAHPRTEVIFAVDFSGSMKGEKIAKARRAFFALAAKTEQNNDGIGLVLFSSEDVKSYPVGTSLPVMLTGIVSEAPRGKTSLERAISSAIRLFSEKHNKKHVILITDMQPTQGTDPEQATLRAAAEASERKISVSVIGIEARGHTLADAVTEMTGGRYYEADRNSVGALALSDYVRDL